MNSTSSLGEKAKRKLAEFVPMVDEKMKKFFDQEIKTGFGIDAKQQQLVKEVLEIAKEFSLRPQKRLRGSLTYYSYLLGGRELAEGMWDAVVGMELIQVALLILDDFMDQDEKRRGGLTVHRIYAKKMNDLHVGESMAVTLGDAILCLGFEGVAKCGNTKATVQVLKGVAETAYGQMYDLSLNDATTWRVESVVMMHAAKTAIYTYKNPLLVGAYLGGIEDQEVLELLSEFAIEAGVAFQLQDDILGVYGTPEKTGKSVDSDLKQGKCTLMVLKAYEMGDTGQQAVVRRVWGNGQATRNELDEAKKAILDCGAYDYNKKVAQDYARKAAETANKLRQFGLNEEAIDYIQGIAEYMVEREV